MTDLTPAEIHQLDSRALELVGIVHGGGGPAEVATLVRGLTPQQLTGIAISCAAMVDPDKQIGQLLEWMNRDDPSEGWTSDELKDAHTKYGRGVRTPSVVNGERIYQRLRKRNNRTREGSTRA
ncbi:hypothetical protein L1080_004440 [Rhodococcus sp. MSC1_016]|jgi:hypothetical protein|uniref:hypothetical protein n=1 Tax=Rhodococcus sp. MSC1_016 TaxID=2909266 RepID=UPI002030B296|nr:hypothetical protein [Rhodococcus sp. MSC1_016]